VLNLWLPQRGEVRASRFGCCCSLFITLPGLYPRAISDACLQLHVREPSLDYKIVAHVFILIRHIPQVQLCRSPGGGRRQRLCLRVCHLANAVRACFARLYSDPKFSLNTAVSSDTVSSAVEREWSLSRSCSSTTTRHL
jgi:hypothetical protein